MSSYVLNEGGSASHGGGVLIAVADSVSSRLVPNVFKIEMVTVALSESPILVSCPYIAPNSCDLYRANILHCIESVVADSSSALTIGEFNSSDINWSNFSASSPFSLSLCDLVFSLNMKQLVTCSTHTHGNTLDLVVTNQHDLVNDLLVNSTTCCAYSDHSLISFHLPIDSL